MNSFEKPPQPSEESEEPLEAEIIDDDIPEAQLVDEQARTIDISEVTDDASLEKYSEQIRTEVENHKRIIRAESEAIVRKIDEYFAPQRKAIQDEQKAILESRIESLRRSHEKAIAEIPSSVPEDAKQRLIATFDKGLKDDIDKIIKRFNDEWKN